MKTTVSFFICFMFFQFINAQQLVVIGTGGGYYQNDKGSVSYSIGEIITKTMEQNGYCITHGFCQANVTITAVDQIDNLDYELNAYPNPVRNFITLKINRDHLTGIKYFLYDMQGQLIKSDQITANQTMIPFNYKPSVYFLRITDGQTEIKYFKIIKAREN